MTEIVFYCKAEHSDEECVTWSPKLVDINTWRDQFPGLDVRTELRKLADWTDRNRSRVKLRKNMSRWVKECLRRNYQPIHESQTRQAAFHELSKPDHERLGMTQDEYDQLQADKHAADQQESIPLQAPARVMPAQASRELSEVKRLLQAQIEADTEAAPAPKIKIADCTHQNTAWFDPEADPNLFNECPDCGCLYHQFRMNWDWQLEQGRMASPTGG